MVDVPSNMSRERSESRAREREKSAARKIREQQASLAEREARQEGPVFRTTRRESNSKSTIESILGNFNSFTNFTKAGANISSLVGVDTQPATPAPARQPIHDPSPPPKVKPTSDARSSSRDSETSRQVKRSQHPQKSGKVLPPHGPGPGPGGGPGGGRDGSMKPPPLRIQSQGTEPDIKQILEEMTIKPPLLTALQTPRPDHLDQVPSVFPFTPITPLKDTPIKDRDSHPLSRKDKTPDLPPSRPKQSKPSMNTSGLSDHLALSEDSDEGGDGAMGFPPRPSPTSGFPSSNAIGLPQPLANLSAAAPKENGRHSPKTSEDSTDDDESESDSESSSSEEEPQPSPPTSPKPQEDTKLNSWTLSNFLPRPNTTTQSSSQSVSPQVHTGSASPVAEPQQKQQRGHPSRSKNHSGGSSSSSSHHRSPRAPAHKLTPKDKPKSQIQPLDTSDDETPTPSKSHPVSRTTPHKYASQELKTKLSDIESEEESRTKPRDWKSSSLNNLSSKSNRSNTISPRRSAPPTPRETPTKLTKHHKRDLNRKLGAKSKSVVSSDCESDIDVLTVSPDMSSRRTPNSQTRHTPQRTPKESQIISPLKIPIPVSPLLSVDKNKQNRLSANLNSESDDLSSAEKSHNNKLEVVNISRKVEKAKEPVAKPVRKIRDANDSRKSLSGSGQRDRSSEKGDKERRSELSDSVDSRLDSVGASPLRQSVPKNTIESKVPIPKVQYVKGNPILECIIPVNLINKVPKVIASPVSIKSPYKSPVKEEDKTIVKEEIRTTGKSGGKGGGKGKVVGGKGKVVGGKGKCEGGKGKGKRKIYDPDASTEDDSKNKVLTSIFINKRVAPKPEEQREVVDKVKKEVKSEPPDSDIENRLQSKDEKPQVTKDELEDGEINTSSTRQRHNSTSSHSSSRSSSRPKKKKKDKHSESSRTRKRNLNDSSDGPTDNGGTNSRDGFERRTRDTSVESERSSSRKREHDTSGESQRARKKAKYMSPSVENRQESAATVNGSGQAVADEATGGPWALQNIEKDNNGDPQRNSNSLVANTSSQVEDMGTTPSAESGGYHSLPASEHESRSSTTAATSPAPSYTMVPPHTNKLQDTAAQPTPNPADNNTSNLTQNAAGAIVPPPSYKNYFERNIPHVSQDHMGYLQVAKQLKHDADKQEDRCWKAVKYLDAVLYFILSGISMEAYDSDINTALTMYQETLRLIKWVSSMFKKEHQEKLMQSKLNVISLRCQSILSMWCYKVGPTESAANMRELQDYWSKHQENQKLSRGRGESCNNGSTRGSSGWNNPAITSGSPSTLSQTPSPAGSVGSEGSQSSGYTSTGDPGPVVTVPVPVNVHNIMLRYHQQSTKLSQAYEMWAEADSYINSKPQMKEFFIELEECHGPLTLHSTLHELFFYVQGGLQRLKTEWQHKVSGNSSLQAIGASGAKLEES